MDASRTAQPPTMSWEMLEKSLVHPNAVIREKAIETAGRFGDARTLVALQEAVRDENARIRAAAAQAFVNAIARRHPEIDAAVARLISTQGDDELRRFLISNSASSDSHPLLRAVIECLVDVSPGVRYAADAALKEQGGTWMFTTAASEAVGVIEAAGQSSNVEVSAVARAWSERLRRAQVRRTMLETGVAAILTLNASLRSDSPVMRAAAAWALSQSSDGRAVPALVDALRDPSEAVRRSAALSLAQLGWSAPTEVERADQIVALGRWSEAVQAGPSAVDSLLRAATQSSPKTQSCAVAALAESKSVRALLPLQELLKSPHATVRRAAALGLKELEWVPATDAQAVAHAIELEDWSGAAELGTPAVAPLMAVLKSSLGQAERTAKITGALEMITDAGAAPSLSTFCRDGEVSSAAVRALEALLKKSAADVEEKVLQDITALSNVVKFQFTIDPQYQRPSRTGMEFVNVDALRACATAELARRKSAPKPTEAA
jgi:HEAT repeat protein